jgi:hypothetical protein
LWLHEFLQVGVSMNLNVRSVVEHSESGYQSHQTETMIAMQVRDENMPEVTVFQPHLPHPYLCSLAAINQELLVPEFQQLRSWKIALRG